MRDDVSCRSSNGGVTVRVGQSVAAGFDLSTSNGDASIKGVPHTVSTSDGDGMTGQIRSASSPTLTVTSTNGNAKIRGTDDE